MTGLVIPYDAVENPFAALTNWSSAYPFRIQDVMYPTVNHYIFCKMTNHRHNASLLATEKDTDLRQKFNRFSDDLYLEYLKEIISEGARLQFFQDRAFRQYLLQRPLYFFYYIKSGDTLWGINEEGYGYNLLGQAYSRLLTNQYSSYYKMTESVIYSIYRANVLLTHHLQQGNDILHCQGRSVEDISEELMALYPDLTFLNSSVAYNLFKKDTSFQNIQMEIDYPWNLAGFVRKQFVQQINYHLRERFNNKMISKYFAYVLQHKFKDSIDASQMEYYVRQQMDKLETVEYQKLADRLFSMYNSPSQNERVLKFLDTASIQELYDIEVQFLNPDEIRRGQKFVPFLYHIKAGRSMYIYDESKASNLQPSNSYLSPHSPHPFSVENFKYDDLSTFIYVQLAVRLTNLSLPRAHALLADCPDTTTCQVKLETAVRTYKEILMKRGMMSKFSHSAWARFLLYNTVSYEFNMTIQDPDPVFEINAPRILLDIRKDLVQSYYPISYYLAGNNVLLQDKIKYRLADFIRTFDAYSLLRNNKMVDLQEYRFLDKYVFKNPAPSRPSRNPMHPEFFNYFEGHCSESVMKELWIFFKTYVHASVTIPSDQSSTPQQSLRSMTSIVCYFIKYFFEAEESVDKFYDFVLTVLVGKDVAFYSSRSFYTTEMEKDMARYLPLDDYSPEFMVDMMGVISLVEKNIPVERHRFFSYVGLPEHSPPYPSSLVAKMSAVALVGMEEAGIEKKGKGKKKRVVAEEPLEEETEEEEEEEEDMFEELGLGDDDDDEDGNEEEEIEMPDGYDEM